jgi:hypothetical protein
MMVYNTQIYWVFGLNPSSGILKNVGHNVLETGSVSNLRWGTYSVGSVRANPNHWTTDEVLTGSPVIGVSFF